MSARHRGAVYWHTSVWIITGLVAGCSDGSGPSNGTCPQTYEFGNIGCARVQGVVRDTAGNPLAMARVNLAPAEGVDNTFDSPTHDTDATGTYSLEIHDYAGAAGHAPQADPVPMTLRAFLLTGSPENPAPVSAPITVGLKFSRVGETPEVLQQDIIIQTDP
jgi:hypothetical protein